MLRSGKRRLTVDTLGKVLRAYPDLGSMPVAEIVARGQEATNETS
jgi:hypothetical protein